jgi:hypothetical protein
MMSKAVQIKPVNKCWRNIIGGVMYIILLLDQIVFFILFWVCHFYRCLAHHFSLLPGTGTCAVRITLDTTCQMAAATAICNITDR